MEERATLEFIDEPLYVKDCPNDFPWRYHNTDELEKEYLRLINKILTPISFPLPFLTVGFKCSNFYFQYERMNTPGIGRPSTIDYWKKKKKHIINFSNKMGHDYFTTLNYFNHTPSHFPIVTAGKIYKYFNATKIFDPYAGWGDRCLAAMALGIDYIGVDKNSNLVIPYKSLVKKYNRISSIKIYNCPSEDIDIHNLNFNFVLTSPPFWKKGLMLERYNDDEIKYNDFLLLSLIPVINKCLCRDIWVCLYIPIDVYNDLVKVFGICQQELMFKTNNRTVSIIYCWKK